jgi:5'-nucleotidase
MSKPLILVSNDDGYQAPGIRYLIDIAKTIGEVVVVAPQTAQSAMSHAITIKTPLHYQTVEISENYREYNLNGTPVDCVKFAIHQLMDRKPDIVISGINHGSNASINIIYSGTMAAATEAAMGGIPSVGFSILDYSEDANFEYAKKYITKIINKVLKDGLAENTTLNVNFPKPDNGNYKGLKVCRQAKAYWKEDFDERFDPRNGKPYYWLKGTFTVNEDEDTTDEWALKNYYVSMVPIQFDFTAYNKINELKHWETL